MIAKKYSDGIFLFINIELSKHLSVFVPLWLNKHKVASLEV